MHPSLLRAAIAVVALSTLFACGGGGGAGGLPPSAGSVEPSPECAPLWRTESALAFAKGLALATAPASPVWVDYQAAQGSFVLNAGDNGAGGSCLGLWQGGRVTSYATTVDPPRLLTPLYGYHFPYRGTGGPFDALVAAATQPESVRAWLAQGGVKTAILMPIDIKGLPFTLTPLQKVQIAIHEAFHVDVQARRWLDSAGDWPSWDLQPDRAGLSACYSGSPAVESALTAERQALDSLINALLDGEPQAACQAGEAFLGRRSRRYEALGAVSVARSDGTMGTCGEAEAVMEMEEGVADYASWSRLFDLGLASRDELIRRYRAQQNDVYYLSGAMQMHAVALMRGGGTIEATRRMAASTSAEVGSPTAMLRESLGNFCATPER